MSHSSNARIDLVDSLITQQASAVVEAVERAEAAYQDLQELFTYAGGTTQLLADLLYTDANGGGTADAGQVAIVQDAVDAALALHELYLAMTNGTVSAADRLNTLRRFT